MNEHARSILLVAAIAALAALMVALFARGGSRAIHAEVEGQDVERRTGSPPVELDGRPHRTVGPEPSAGLRPSALRGRVLDELFGVPVAARIQPDRGPGRASDRESGRFELGEENAGANSLLVSAAGYEERRVELGEMVDAESLEIRLRAARQAAVIVERADGSPAAGLPVSWRAAVDRPERKAFQLWMESAEFQSGDRYSSVTDFHGASRVPISVPSLAAVEDPRSGTAKTVRVQPGQEVLVVLPERALTVKIVDAETLEPLPGTLLRAWCPRESFAMSESLRADGDGHVAIAPTSFPVLLRLPGSRALQHELIPLSSGAARAGMGGDSQTTIRVDEPPGEDPIVIALRQCAGRIRLLDRASREPIRSPVRVKRLFSNADCGDGGRPGPCTVQSPRSDFLSPDQVFHPLDGLLVLPCHLEGAVELSRGADPSAHLVVAVAGHRPLRIDRSSELLLDEGGIPTYLLERAEPRMLRVVHDDGLAFTQAVCIYSPAEDLYCYLGEGTRDGMHGPFDWVGGPVLVASGVGANWNWSVSAAELEASEIVTLVVPSHTGSLVVEGAPEEATGIVLIAKLGVRTRAAVEYFPSAVESGTCRFDHLPAGSYLVGPIDWVIGAEMQSMSFGMGEDGTPRRMRTPVRRDETSRVQWQSSWMAGREVEGRVTLRGGGRVELFLVPLHGPGGETAGEEPGRPPRLIFGRGTPRIPLDRDGRYRIAATDPLPRLLAVCASDDTLWGGVNGLHVLEAIEPGDSVEIPAAVVEFRWKGDAPNRPVQAGYVVPIESLRRPLFTFHTRSLTTWMPGTVLRLEGVPVHVRELYVAGRPIPIELREGEILRLDVDLDALPPPRNMPR